MVVCILTVIETIERYLKLSGCFPEFPRRPLQCPEHVEYFRNLLADLRRHVSGCQCGIDRFVKVLVARLDYLSRLLVLNCGAGIEKLKHPELICEEQPLRES